MSGTGCLPASIGITRHITVINAENAACPRRQAAFLINEPSAGRDRPVRIITIKYGTLAAKHRTPHMIQKSCSEKSVLNNTFFRSVV